MQKRVFATLLFATLSIFMLTGCGHSPLVGRWKLKEVEGTFSRRTSNYYGNNTTSEYRRYNARDVNFDLSFKFDADGKGQAEYRFQRGKMEIDFDWSYDAKSKQLTLRKNFGEAEVAGFWVTVDCDVDDDELTLKLDPYGELKDFVSDYLEDAGMSMENTSEALREMNLAMLPSDLEVLLQQD